MVSESERLHSIEMLERIEEKRVAAGITKAAMYKASGTSSSAFSQWKTGLTKPATKSIAALAECLHTTPQYLMFGVKEKRAAHIDGLSRIAADIARRFEALDEQGKGAVMAILQYEEARQRPAPEIVDLTIRHYFSSPAAGFAGMEAGEDYEDIPLPADAPRNADYCITVSGDSMEPYFPDGSLAYVLRDAPISDFDVGIFLVDGSVYIKQFCRGYGGEIYLLSANPKRESANITIRPGSNQRIEYRGKVIVKKKLPQPVYD